MAEVRLVRNEAEIKRMFEGLGYGLLNLGLFVMARYQGSMPQGSGPLPRPRSAPGEPPAVQTGNLRRSAHAVLYVGGGTVAEVGPSPGYGSEMTGELGVIVGSNTGYGLFLEVGTGKMAARPALVPAAIEGQQQAQALIAEGAKRRYRGSP